MTPEMKEKYLSNPDQCPSCDHRAPVVQDSWYEDGLHRLHFICRSDECDYKWVEEYKLIETYEVEQ